MVGGQERMTSRAVMEQALTLSGARTLATRSLPVMMPIGSFSGLTTTRKLIPCSVRRRATALTVASGVQVTTGEDMISESRFLKGYDSTCIRAEPECSETISE